MTVANPGDVLTKGEGSLSLATKDGQEVFTRPMELGTVLPGDSTFFRADAPMDPGPGSYVVAIALRTPGGQDVHASADIAIGNEKVNGCSAVAGAEEGPSGDAEGEGGVLGISGVGGGGIPWLIVLLIALVVLLALLLARRELRDWRRRATAAGEGRRLTDDRGSRLPEE